MDYGRASKARSWDEFGPRYWDLVADLSKPSPHEVDLFLAGSGQGSNVLVVGATTQAVVAAALDRGAQVTVMDFAPRLLEKLAGTVPEGKVELVRQDIQDVPRADLHGTFDVVASDRLINRFHRSEMATALSNMALLTKHSGQVRTSIRLGLHPRDIALMAEGRRRGTLESFWDEATRSLDWSKVGEELVACAEAYGSVPREVVIAWSRERGVESRLMEEDIPTLIAETRLEGQPLRLESVQEMDRAPNTKLFALARPPRAGGGGT